MTLDNIIVCCLTRDRISQEFTQKIIDYINRSHRSGRNLHPETEEAFGAGSFSGGEFHPQFRRKAIDPAGKDVYLVGIPTVPMGFKHKVTPGELMNRVTSAAQTAYDSGASNVYAVLTNFMFARADKRQSDFREGTDSYEKNSGAGRVLLSQLKNFWANDIKGIITVDHHSDSLFDFAEDVWGHGGVVHSLDTTPLTAHYLTQESIARDRLMRNYGSDFVLAAVDKGIKAKINKLMGILQEAYGLKDISAIYLDKLRKHPNNPDELLIRVNQAEPYSDNFTTLADKVIVVMDDMVDTAGSMEKALGHIASKGIRCNGSAPEKPSGAVGIFTHPVLAGISYDEPMKKLLSAGLSDLAMYNTHPFIEEKVLYPLKKKTTIIRLAKPLSEAISLHSSGRDINSMFYTEGRLNPEKVSELYNQKRSTSHVLNRKE